MNNSTQFKKEFNSLSHASEMKVLTVDTDTDLNNINFLALQLCNVPIAVIYLNDEDRFVTKIKSGSDINSQIIEHFLVESKLTINGLTIIDNISEDFRFKTSQKQVEPVFRFFAAIPIVTKNHQQLGLLYALDVVPHLFTNDQEMSLAILSEQVAQILDQRNTSAQDLVVSELKKQKDFFESILNNLPVDIAVFDTQHNYIFVNPVAIRNEKLREFIIGKDDFEYAKYMGRDNSVAELRREQFKNIIESKKEIRWEEVRKAPDGIDLTHLRRLLPVYNQDQEITMVLGFGIDITDRKKQSALVNQLSLQNVQLVDFCNIVSHNLRSPLVNLSMLVNHIKTSADQEEQQMLIGKMTPVLNSLHEIFNELVESIQIKQDLEIQSENVNLNEAINKTMLALEMEIMDSGAEIEIDFTATPWLNYPSKYINSIFLNVLSNAIKYRSPKRTPQIKLQTKIDGGKILFTINDNGLGVNLDRHKNNFFKIGKVFHRHPNAKGFGLFMTRTQVEAMGGRIWLESTPDVGSTFYIEFENQNT